MTAVSQVAPAQSFGRGLLKSRMCGSVRKKRQEEALLASAMHTVHGHRPGAHLKQFCLRPDFGYKKLNQSASSNLDYG